ncbi:MAG TPA: MarR family transcriptional regulator [Vicinamibacterales bacterium]
MTRRAPDASLTDFGQAIGLLFRRLRALNNQHDLSWTQSAVLSRLAKDGPATTADLARAESMKPQSMGSVVASLEELDLVGRAPHPTDGRQVHLTLTAKGAALRKRLKEAKWEWLADAVAKLDEKERDTLFEAADIIKRLAGS